MGVLLLLNIWVYICGLDLVCDSDGIVYVLEDNLCVLFGVFYMLENCLVMKWVFLEFFESYNIQLVDDYCFQLFDMLVLILSWLADYLEVVVLMFGIFNLVYFEYVYLVQQMGCELVEGWDLVVQDDDCVYMWMVEGLQQVDVIYCRIDDLFLDLEVFDKDFMLGVFGLLCVWKKGKVVLVNVLGVGVVDDKVVYVFVLEIIKYYLGEEVLLFNVFIYCCMYEKEQEYVFNNLVDLVVKFVNEFGGYGMLIGFFFIKKECEKFVQLIKKDFCNYIVQFILGLFMVLIFIDNWMEFRYVDL